MLPLLPDLRRLASGAWGPTRPVGAGRGGRVASGPSTATQPAGHSYPHPLGLGDVGTRAALAPGGGRSVGRKGVGRRGPGPPAPAAIPTGGYRGVHCDATPAVLPYDVLLYDVLPCRVVLCRAAPCSPPLADPNPLHEDSFPLAPGRSRAEAPETSPDPPWAPRWPHAPCPRTGENKGHGHECPGEDRAAGSPAPTRKLPAPGGVLSCPIVAPPRSPAGGGGGTRPPGRVLAHPPTLVSSPHHGEVTRSWAAVGVAHTHARTRARARARAMGEYTLSEHNLSHTPHPSPPPRCGMHMRVHCRKRAVWRKSQGQKICSGMASAPSTTADRQHMRQSVNPLQLGPASCYIAPTASGAPQKGAGTESGHIAPVIPADQRQHTPIIHRPRWSVLMNIRAPSPSGLPSPPAAVETVAPLPTAGRHAPAPT